MCGCMYRWGCLGTYIHPTKLVLPINSYGIHRGESYYATTHRRRYIHGRGTHTRNSNSTCFMPGGWVSSPPSLDVHVNCPFAMEYQTDSVLFINANYRYPSAPELNKRASPSPGDAEKLLASIQPFPIYFSIRITVGNFPSIPLRPLTHPSRFTHAGFGGPHRAACLPANKI